MSFNNIESTLIEVKLKADFLVVMETLSRIGVAHDRNLFQSCHILSRNQKKNYYIVHFKEMFVIDGRNTSFDENDRKRRDAIAKLMEQWNLVEIVEPSRVKLTDDEMKSMIQEIKVVPYSQKDRWTFHAKYKHWGRKKVE